MLVELNEGEGDARDLTSKPGLDAVRHLKSHLEAREMHAQHQAMVQAIQAEFKKRSLYDVAEVVRALRPPLLLAHARTHAVRPLC